MKEITCHLVEGAASELEILAIDEPGPGGAHHEYRIAGGEICYEIRFQKGPIGESGVNGLTNEALAALIIDRLACFQAGPFASDYNENALAHFTAGLEQLKQRTRDRLRRGVEGQNKA